MRKLFLIFLISLFHTSSSSQNKGFEQLSKTVTCGPLEKVMRVLTDESIDEKPIWTGKSDDNQTSFALFANTETKSFTLIQFNKEHACVLGTGFNAKTVRPKSYY